MQINQTRQFLTFVEGKYFRVSTIAKVTSVDSETHELIVADLPVSNGLAIEKFNGYHENKKCYYVVAFVKPHERKKNSLDTESVVFMDTAALDLIDVDFRTVDMIDESMSMEDLWEMMQEYKNCVEFAQRTISEALRNE